MKTLFVALSSSYIHTVLAARYLAANSTLSVDVYETNVNVPLEKTLSHILDYRPDVLAFSCYIFNISYIVELLKKVRSLLPACKVILGGYEAAGNVEKLSSLCDHIIKGEGDHAFGELLVRLQNNEVCIPKVIEAGTVKSLDDIVSPYTDEYLSLIKKNHIVYFETCRGCPFDCSYCMSSTTHGVRSFSDERIFSDLRKIMAYDPPLLKFVDRTFNYDKRRAERIFSFLIDTYGHTRTRFHFEMAPELFDENLFACISRAPKGLFQFEIGVQSYNGETLVAVHRKADPDVVDANVRRLVAGGNVVVHVDLIAGLPCENKKTFIEGFDRLLSLHPDCMQSGFLKILKGSRMERESAGYVVRSEPPYEIVRSPEMSESDLIELKETCEMLDLYYNSERFKRSMAFLLTKRAPYELFRGLADAFSSSPFEKRYFSSTRQCDLLFDYAKTFLSEEDVPVVERLIYEDFAADGNVRKWHRFLKKEEK